MTEKNKWRVYRLEESGDGAHYMKSDVGTVEAETEMDAKRQARYLYGWEIEVEKIKTEQELAEEQQQQLYREATEVLKKLGEILPQLTQEQQQQLLQQVQPRNPDILRIVEALDNVGNNPFGRKKEAEKGK